MKTVIKYIILTCKIFRLEILLKIKKLRFFKKFIGRKKQTTDDEERELRKLKLERRNLPFPRFLLPRKIKGKHIIVLPCLDAGFFSIFNNYISHLVYAREDEMILPDWRLNNILLEQIDRLAFNDFKLVSFCYGTRQDGNVFYKLFENPYPEIGASIYETDRMYHYASEILSYWDYNEAKEPNLTALNSYNLYSDTNYFPVFRGKYNEVLKKYIHLRPEIQKRLDAFAEENFKDHFVISAFIRCKAHALELKESSPDLNLWEDKLLEILEENNISVLSDKWRFFIASDNEDAIHFFSKKYPQNTLFQKMQRLTHEQEKEYETKRNELGHDTWGYELQQRKAADESQHSIQNAIEVIFDVYMAAKADYLIYTNSNMSTAASYINPKLIMVYCRKGK